MARARRPSTPRLSLFLAFLTLLAFGLAPHARLAAAAPNPGSGSEDPPPPDPLPYPAGALVGGSDVGYLPGGSSVSPSGDYQYSVPLDVPAGRAGMQPALGLAYSSRGGNGLLGVGWSIQGLSEIGRCGRTIATEGVTAGVRFGPADGLCLDGRKLVLVAGTAFADGAEYRTERDSFAKIVFHTGQGGPSTFVVFGRDGHISTYTAVLATRVRETTQEADTPDPGDPSDPGGPSTKPGNSDVEEGPDGPGDFVPYMPVEVGRPGVSWPITQVQDRSGNFVRYHYERDPDGEAPFELSHRIERIEYTGKIAESNGDVEEPGRREVVFHYKDRGDESFFYVGGVRLGVTKLLESISMHAPWPIEKKEAWRYELDYDLSADSDRNLLVRVGKLGDGARLWRKEFRWSEAGPPAFHPVTVAFPPGWTGTFKLADVDGDGRDDLLIASPDPGDMYNAVPRMVCRTTGTAAWPFDHCASVSAPETGHQYALFGTPIDLDGDGAQELVGRRFDQNEYGPVAAGYQALHYDVATASFKLHGDAFGASHTRLAFVDIDGDGRAEAFQQLDEDGSVQVSPNVPDAWFFRPNIDGQLGPLESTGVAAANTMHFVALDLDGDGRGELLTSSNVDGAPEAGSYSLGLSDAGQLDIRNTWKFHPFVGKLLIDLNGDGLKDLYKPPSLLWWNLGTGFSVVASIEGGPTLHGPPKARAIDIDGDGREDIVSFNDEQTDEDGNLEAADHVFLHLSRFPRSTPFETIETDIPTRAKLGDVDGDGFMDFVHTSGDDIVVHLQDVRFSDLLEEVWDEDASQPREQIYYAYREGVPDPDAECVYPQRCTRRAMLVVSEVWQPQQGLSALAARRMEYDYEDPRFDIHGRGFLGFGEVTATDRDAIARTVTTYDHQTWVDGVYPYAGLPQTVTRIAAILPAPVDRESAAALPASGTNRVRVSQTANTYTTAWLNGGSTYFPRPSAWMTTEWEQEAEGLSLVGEPDAATVRERHGATFYDDFQNVVFSSSLTVGGDRCHTYFTYDDNEPDWLLGLLRRKSVACGKDGQPLPDSRVTEYEHDERGLLRMVTVEPDLPPLLHRTVFERNADGLVTKTTEIAWNEPARTRFVAYDEERVFPRATWNALAHYDRAVVHPALGVALLSEDPNGVRTRTKIDGLGRIRSVDPDGGALVTFAYAADDRLSPGHPTGLIVTAESEDGGARIAFSDSQGRTIEEASRRATGEWVHRGFQHNRLGQLVRATRPGLGAPSLNETVMVLDTLGRAIEIASPEGAVTTFDHAMFETETVDPAGRRHKERTDKDGRVVESLDRTQHGIQLPWLSTRYTYGDFGLLTRIVDPEGHETLLAHDKLGRRILLDDPDAGITTFAYNGFGDLTAQTDALGHTVETERDVLGRVTFTHHPVDGIASFVYDQGDHARGRLSAATSADGVAMTLAYDGHGRLAATSWTLAGGFGAGTYAIDRTYDDLGRLDLIKYPEVPGRNRFVTKSVYDAAGAFEAAIPGDAGGLVAATWQVHERNLDGAVVESSWNSGAIETRDHDPETGRLVAIGTTRPDHTSLFAFEYTHHPDGNIQSRTDQLALRAETFQYDALNRLQDWSLALPNQPVRETAFAYDDLGNLEQVRVNGGLKEEHLHDGVLDPDGVLRMPHALTQLDAAGTMQLHYDARGRQTSNGQREVEYNAFDLPEQISGGTLTHFEYDASGTRVRKTRTDGPLTLESTVTLGGLYERRQDVAGGAIQHVFYMHGDTGPVAQVVYTEASPAGSSEKTLHLQTDQHGSIAAVYEGLMVADRVFHDPFGRRIDEDGELFAGPTSDVLLGFTGHRDDPELGLIDMKGRVFDPTQRRFLTPDPLVSDPLFGQAYNRYSYVQNNPIRFIDPSGHNGITFGPPELDMPQGQGLASAGFAWNAVQGAVPTVSQPQLCTGRPCKRPIAAADEASGDWGASASDAPTFNPETAAADEHVESYYDRIRRTPPRPVPKSTETWYRGRWIEPEGIDWFVTNGERIAGTVAAAGLLPLLAVTTGGLFMGAAGGGAAFGGTAFAGSGLGWLSGLMGTWVGGRSVIFGVSEGDEGKVAEGLLFATSGWAMVGEGWGSGPRAPGGGSAETMVRLRHYTNSKGINGIEGSGVIRARDRGSVFFDKASGRPMSGGDAEDTFGIKPGHGRHIVETDVPADRVIKQWNTEWETHEYRVVGDVPLSNPTFTRR